MFVLFFAFYSDFKFVCIKILSLLLPILFFVIIYQNICFCFDWYCNYYELNIYLFFSSFVCVNFFWGTRQRLCPSLYRNIFFVSFFNVVWSLIVYWRATVSWPCHGSKIISCLIVIWNEWFGEAWAVLIFRNFIEFNIWVKILRCFYREDTSEFYIHIIYFYVCFGYALCGFNSFVGVRGRIYVTSLSIDLRTLSAPTHAQFYVLCTLLLICSYMFQHSWLPQGD